MLAVISDIYDKYNMTYMTDLYDEYVENSP